MKRPNDLAALVESLTVKSSNPASFNNIGGSGASDLMAANGDSTAASSGLNELLTQLRHIASESHPAPVASRTKAQQSANSNSSGNLGLDVLKGVATAVTDGLIPLASGLINLFSGESSAAPEPLPKFALPPSIQAEAGLNGSGGLSLVDRNLNGDLRGANATGSTNITVQVNAMDSQSFMDRSGDIAQAVRSAMLNSSALNEVIQDM